MARRSPKARKTPTNKGSRSAAQTTPIAVPKGALRGLSASSIARARENAARGDAVAVGRALAAAKGQRTRQEQRVVARITRETEILSPANDRMVRAIASLAVKQRKGVTSFEALGLATQIRAIAELPDRRKGRRAFTSPIDGGTVSGDQAIMQYFGLLHLQRYTSRFYFGVIRGR